MVNIQAMAGGSVGYVRGVFSGRARGVVFPIDLVRAVLKTAARLGVRRRMARAFGGYLVSEPGPEFSARRGVHDLGFDGYAASWDGNLGGVDVHGWGCLSGPIDAPDLIAAGSVLAVGCGWLGGGIPNVIDREAAFNCGPEISRAEVDPLERAFSGRRWMHVHLPLHCAGDHFRDSEFLPWARGIDRGALDAAAYIAAGSAVPLCVLSSGVVLTQTSVIRREAWK